MIACPQRMLIYFATQVKKMQVILSFFFSWLPRTKAKIIMMMLLLLLFFEDRITRKLVNINLSFRTVVARVVLAEPQWRTRECRIEKSWINMTPHFFSSPYRGCPERGGKGSTLITASAQDALKAYVLLMIGDISAWSLHTKLLRLVYWLIALSL